MSDAAPVQTSILPISTIAGPGLPPLDAGQLEPHDLSAALAGIAAPTVPTMNRLAELRNVYWQNVTREMLAAFAMLVRKDGEIGDGRVSVMTTQGERVPVSDIEPLFPCSVVDNERDRQLCMAVQCTVFNIRTPVGEIVTLPLHEITSVRVLSNDLLKQLEAAASRVSPGDESEPFGFAAYTSLAKQEAQNKRRGER
ncbi:MAG: hypothetical protein ACTS27_04900 [Phycisphaerales bacterium]